jgi:hypothetical protein
MLRVCQIDERAHDFFRSGEAVSPFREGFVVEERNAGTI